MSHKDLFLQLFPIRLGEDYDLDVELEANFLDSAQSMVEALLEDLIGPTPGLDTVLRRETMFGLVPAPGATLDDRRAAIAAAWQKVGGLSKAYFTGLAAALGFTVAIEDMRPFECGVSMCGFPIWEEGIKWCWTVRVLNHTTVVDDFAGADPAAYTGVGDPYLWKWDAVAGPLETLFQKLKPPGGMVLFNYPTVTYP